MALLDGLVSYWKLDEASGDALDAHGTAQLTDISSVGSVPGKIGNARDFSANRYFIRGADANHATGDIDFTFSLWVKFDTLPAVATGLISKWSTPGSEEYLVYYFSSRFRWYVNGPAGVNFVDSPEFTSIGVWYHLVCWHDAVNNLIGISVNDGAANVVPVSGGVTANPAVAFIVGAYDTTQQYHDGQLDEIGFWKRLLTPTDRTLLYNGGAGFEYPFPLTGISGTGTLIAQPAVVNNGPGVPTAVSGVNQGNGTTLVSFTAPVNNGGSPITGYTVTGSDGFTKSGPSSPLLISNNGSGSVTYTVRANNAIASSPPSVAFTLAISRTVAASFHIDNAGNDQNSGHSLGAAWSTIDRANAFTFRAGDQLIFTAGQTFTGNLLLTESGAAGQRICVGTGRILPSDPVTTYIAQSNPATINCGVGTAVRLEENEYWSIDNLHMLGTTLLDPLAIGVGVDVPKKTADPKRLGNSITAVSITGTSDGIIVWTPTGQPGQDGLRIVGCHIHDVARVGIIITDYDRDTAAGGGNGGTLGQGTFTQNANIYIGYCNVHHCPNGEGLTVRNTTGGLVEHCVVHHIALNNSGSSGLDTTITDGVTFQYCEVYEIFTPNNIDGVGCDFENSRNCILQYCYIHDCDGAGYFSGMAVAGLPDQTGNVVRYNVFSGNARKNQAEWVNFGNIKGFPGQCYTDFYGNTLYAIKNAWLPRPVDRGWNNIFVSGNNWYCIDADASAPAQIVGNLYFAKSGTTYVKLNSFVHTSLASLHSVGYEQFNGDRGVYGQDPLLLNPVGAPSGGTMPGAPVSTITNFDLQAGSPAIGAGVLLSLLGVTDGGLDFHGSSTAADPINTGADAKGSIAQIATAVLAAQSASLSGAGGTVVIVPGSGVLAAGAATMASAGVSRSTGIGVLAVTQRATITGTGTAQGAGQAVLVAGSALVSGAGNVITVAPSTGVLISQSATLSATGASAMTGAGVLQAAAATVSGEERVAIGTGVLQAGRAVVTGTGTRSGAAVSVGIESAIMDRIGALVNGRAYPNTFPQEAGAPIWPAIRYTLVSVDPVEDLCCDSEEEEGTDTSDVRVQFDVVAATYVEARDLRLAMKRAMLKFDPPAVPSNEFNTYDTETKVHRVVMDYVFYPSSD